MSDAPAVESVAPMRDLVIRLRDADQYTLEEMELNLLEIIGRIQAAGAQTVGETVDGMDKERRTLLAWPGFEVAKFAIETRE